MFLFAKCIGVMYVINLHSAARDRVVVDVDDLRCLILAPRAATALLCPISTRTLRLLYWRPVLVEALYISDILAPPSLVV